METVKLGVVGLGAIFQIRHAKALEEIPEAVIAAVADVDEDVARTTGERYGCAWMTDYREMVGDDAVDAVMVCTPPFVHEEVAVAAARAGKHVFCEKPLAPTLDGCDAIIKAAADAGVKLMVAENFRFDPLTIYLKECVADGRFGRLRRMRMIQSWWGPEHRRLYQSPHPGRNGTLLEDGIHKIAVSRALLGEVKAITCVARTVIPVRKVEEGEIRSQVEDDVAITLQFDGATAVAELAWLVDVGGLHSEFLFERATIIVSNPGWNTIQVTGIVKNDDGDLVALKLPDFEVRAPSGPASYVNENRAFIRSILDDTPCPYPGEEGREDVRLVELAYRSAETGRTLDAAV